MMQINDRQKRYVAEYLIDLNATQAAIRAGYSVKGAHVRGAELLKNRKVAAAIQKAMTERSERTEITQDYVLNSIVETMERCKQAEPVKYQNGDQVYVGTPDGEITPSYKFDAGAVLRGAELLGRHLAMFTDNVRHAGKDGGPILHEVQERADAFMAGIAASVSRGKGKETRH